MPAIGPPGGAAGSASARGSMKTSARPPRNRNCSNAYDCRGVATLGCTSISTSTSSSISSSMMSRSLRSNRSLIGDVMIQGSVTAVCIGSKPPVRGRLLTRPTTGSSVRDSEWTSLARSYSRNCSRCGFMKAMNSSSPTAFEPATPKYSGSSLTCRRTACRPKAAARSSSSENGAGSMMLTSSRPSEWASNSLSMSSTRSAQARRPGLSDSPPREMKKYSRTGSGMPSSTL